MHNKVVMALGAAAIAVIAVLATLLVTQSQGSHPSSQRSETATVEVVPATQTAEEIVRADGYETTKSVGAIPSDIAPYVEDAAVGVNLSTEEAEMVVIFTPAGTGFEPMFESMLSGYGLQFQFDGRVMKITGTVEQFESTSGATIAA